MRGAWFVAGVTALFVLLSSVPHDLSAQGRLPRVGDWGVSFSLPGDAPEGGLALRTMVSRHANLGLGVSFGVTHFSVDGAEAGEGTSWQVGFEPDLRLYQRPRGAVAPFVYSGLGVGYGRSRTGEARVTGSFRLGLGAEWFPTRGMSLAGATGLAAAVSSSDSENGDRTHLSAGLFRSRLALAFYF